MKFQCPYRIKDARQIGWFNCQLQEGHEPDHVPPPAPVGRTLMVEGIWHRPGEKSTADPEPRIEFVGAGTSELNIQRPATSSEGSNVQSQARSNK
jgi:hypothetical protein